jgi:hypothetical protein
MLAGTSLSQSPAAIRVDLGAIFVSMELSRSKWLITSLSPGGGETMSKHVVAGGDLSDLFERFGALQEKARTRTGREYRIIVIQEAGLDGFWIHRALEDAGVESHVVDPASIATSRRARRAKTDRIDAGAGAAGLQARGASGLLHGPTAEPAGGGSTAHPTRAQGTDHREGQARQPDQGTSVRPRDGSRMGSGGRPSAGSMSSARRNASSARSGRAKSFDLRRTASRPRERRHPG